MRLGRRRGPARRARAGRRAGRAGRGRAGCTRAASRRGGTRAGPAAARPRPGRRSPTRTGRRRARRCRPRRATTAIAFAPAEPIGTSSPPSSLGERSTNRRAAASVTDDDAGPARRWRDGGRGGRCEASAPRRAARPRRRRARRRPTSATCTAQSVAPGSPNSRVPSSGSTIQTRLASRRPVVLALLRQHGVVRVGLLKPADEQLVRAPVAGRSEPPPGRRRTRAPAGSRAADLRRRPRGPQQTDGLSPLPLTPSPPEGAGRGHARSARFRLAASPAPRPPVARPADALADGLDPEWPGPPDGRCTAAPLPRTLRANRCIGRPPAGGSTPGRGRY